MLPRRRGTSVAMGEAAMTGLKRHFGAVACALALCELAACSGYELNERALDFNAALAQNDNRQVLLNAARASRHYPLYFTTISKVTSSGLLQQASLGFTLPFGGGASPVGRTVTPAVELEEGFSVDTSPLNTQEFFNGFLEPIQFRTFDYYVKYDWDPELIYDAFIRRVTISSQRAAEIAQHAAEMRKSDPGGAPAACIKPILSPRDAFECFRDRIPNADVLADPKLPKDPSCWDPPDPKGTVTFTNSPAQPCRFVLFQLLVAEMRELKFTLIGAGGAGDQGAESKKSDKKQSSDDAQSDQAKDSSAEPYYFAEIEMAPHLAPHDSLASGQCQKFIINKGAKRAKTWFPLTPEALQVTQQALEISDKANKKLAVLDRLGRTDAATEKERQAATAAKDKALRPFEPLWAVGNQDFDTYVCATADVPPIVLRSPEGMIFYMGEIIRAENPDQPNSFSFMPQVNIGRHAPSPLLTVCRSVPFSGECTSSDTKNDAIVSVSLDDGDYYVPRSAVAWPNQSMHFFTLFEQILALQKKASTLPTTPTVRVISP